MARRWHMKLHRLTLLHILLWLSFNVWGQVQGDVSSATECSPEIPTDPTLACAWTADCEVSGCENKCTANAHNLNFIAELRDFSFSENSYEACPRMAMFVLAGSGGVAAPLPPATAVPAAAPVALQFRRLLEFTSSTELDSTPSAPTYATPELVHMARVLNQLSPTLFPYASSASPATHRTADGLLPTARRLLDTPATADEAPDGEVPGGEDAPPTPPPPDDSTDAPSPESGISADAIDMSNIPPYLRLDCPSGSDVDASALVLAELARQLKPLFIAHRDGQLLPGDLVQLQPYLQNRNFFRVMLPYLQDSARLKAFLSERCAPALVRYPNTTIYLSYLAAPPTNLTSQDRMLICADSLRDSLGEWLSTFGNVIQFCEPPFNAAVDCFPGEARFVPSSAACASALASAFNVSDVPLQTASASITAVHTACSQVDVPQQCLTATAPDAFATITEARGGFSYKAKLPGDGPTAGPLNPPLSPPPPNPPPTASAPGPAAPLPPSAEVIGSIPTMGAAPAAAPAEPASSPIGTVIFPLGFGFPSGDDAGSPFEDAAAVETAETGVETGGEDQLMDNPQVAPQDLQSAAHSTQHCVASPALWLCMWIAASMLVLLR
eukprot:jgi/Ulvmu1/9706/UM055_0044.1